MNNTATIARSYASHAEAIETSSEKDEPNLEVIERPLEKDETRALRGLRGIEQIATYLRSLV